MQRQQKKRTYSIGNLKTQTISSLKKFTSTQNDIIQNLLKSKITTYSRFRIRNQNNKLSISPKKIKKRQKIVTLDKQFPQFDSITDLLLVEKQLCHIYRERIQSNFQEGFYICMRLIQIAIQYECIISRKKINKNRTILLQTFIFVAQTLFQLSYYKLTVYFAVLSVQLGHTYRDFLHIGKALLILGRTSRKNCKYKQSILLLKKSLQYLWMNRTSTSTDLEIEVYNQLSYNFLQSNMPQQSKLFAQKYQIGYLESDDSKILKLSKQLVTSLHKRLSIWYQVQQKQFKLLLKYNIRQIINNNQLLFRNSIDQIKILQKFQINYQLFYDNFFKHQMFFYQIPLPLEIKRQQLTLQNKKIFHAIKFVSKQKSKSMVNLKVYKQNQKVQQQIILNYRGIGISKKKLVKMLIDLLKAYSKSYHTIQKDQNVKNVVL